MVYHADLILCGLMFYCRVTWESLFASAAEVKVCMQVLRISQRLLTGIQITISAIIHIYVSVLLPMWMMRRLRLVEGAECHAERVRLPVAEAIDIRPHDPAFFRLHDHRFECIMRLIEFTHE